MHELPVMEKILDIIIRNSMNNNVKRVLSITLETGALSDMEPEWMNYYFKKISRGTLAEKAYLKVIKQEARQKCRQCGNLHTFIKSGDNNCPICGSSNWQLEADSHYTIREMEVI